MLRKMKLESYLSSYFAVGSQDAEKADMHVRGRLGSLEMGKLRRNVRGWYHQSTQTMVRNRVTV